ncbi:MAG: response regulator, partial [Kiritimatiellae bacterium]|nr:response regulator [Kiritimatiellia bacterium]
MSFAGVAEILLVDDERTVREGLKRMLECEGFAVRTARDGADALVKFAQKRPDAILLDVMMPKLNGFAVCAEIRKTDALLPVVFLTAKDSEADEIRG